MRNSAAAGLTAAPQDLHERAYLDELALVQAHLLLRAIGVQDEPAHDPAARAGEFAECRHVGNFYVLLHARGKRVSPCSGCPPGPRPKRQHAAVGVMCHYSLL